MPTTEGYNGAYTGAQIDDGIAKANAALANPAGGTAGQVLTKTESGAAWADAPVGISLATATLTSSGWTDNKQTVTVQGVLADKMAQAIGVSPATSTDAAAWGQAGAWCAEQGANSLTFTCTTAPTADISINIKIQEATANAV